MNKRVLYLLLGDVKHQLRCYYYHKEQNTEEAHLNWCWIMGLRQTANILYTKQTSKLRDIGE